MSDPYPVTIITTRYGGAYEGGSWAAFNCDPEAIPDDATGCDPEADLWWSRPSLPVGVGSTPDKALAALIERMAAP